MNVLPVKKVVVPIDFSDASLAAVDVGLQFAAADNVHVVHVLPEMAGYEATILWSSVTDGGQQHHAEIAIKERLTNPRFADVRRAVRVGDAGHEIVAYAKEIGANLIVIPSHGRRGLSHFLIGSVAERVVRLAHCPVLVLKGKTETG